MDKNNSSSSSSSSSVCRKIRQALSSNPAFKAVQRITSFNQEQEPNKPLTKNPNSPSSNNITNISIQSKPHPHHKPHTHGSGAIPIKFDHSTPKLSDHNGKKSSITTSVAEGAPSERATKVPAKGKPHHVSMQGKQHGQVVHYSEPRGKKQVDINEHFKEFIENTKEKMMRSVTNIGNWGQSNHHHPEDAEDHEAHGSNKNESNFSEFIQTVGKKLRTTTTVRKSGSLREK